MPTTGKRAHSLVFVVYLLLAIGLTFPIITAPGRLVPGSNTWAYDEYTFLWNAWWFKHSLLDLGANPLYSPYTFYPVGAPLVLYTYNFLYCSLGLPIYLASNLPLASNVTLWLGLAAGGYTAYLLARHIVTRRLHRRDGVAAQLAPFLAGLAYAFAASRFIYLALGHYMLLAVATLPLFALFLLRALCARRWRRYAALAGLALALSAFAEMTFALFLGLLLLVFGVVARRRLGWRSLLARVVLLLGVALLAYAPLLFFVLREALTGGYALEGWGSALHLSADLLGLLSPTALHPAWGADWAGELRAVSAGSGHFGDVNTFFIGYATLALAVIGAVAYGRRARAWTVTAVAAIVLSLGPLLQIGGRYQFDLGGLQTTVPLPFIILHYIPLANAGRAPNRFSVLALLALAPLVGLGAYWLLSRLRYWYLASAVAAILAMAIIWDGLSVPLPTTDASIPSFYSRLAEEPGDFAIMTLPFGLRSSFGTLGAEQTQLQYYQTLHEKRLIGGNVSRAPSISFEYYQRIAPSANLLAIESYQQPQIDLERERREAAELAALLDICYLVVHAPVPGRLPYSDTYDEALAYAASVFSLTEVYRDPNGRLVAYAVGQGPLPDSLEVDLGGGSDGMYLGEGWSSEETIAGASARWVDGRRAGLYLPVDRLNQRVLVFSAAPFVFPGAPPQSLTVLVNGREAASFQMAPAWQEYRVIIPAGDERHAPNEVQLRLGYARRPAEVQPQAYSIGSTGLIAPVHLEVHGRRDLAYITVGSADGSRHIAGLNVAVFDARKGTLLASEAFAWAESRRLASFIQGLPDGRGVLIAAEGGVPDALDPLICSALSSVGGAGCPPPGVGGYALIGAKGAATGAALEASGEDAYLRVSPDRRALSAAVDWLRFERLP